MNGIIQANLNDEITLTLRPRGVRILRAHWSHVPGNIDAILESVYPLWKETGKVRMPIWQFAQIFGAQVHVGDLDQPFEAAIELRSTT